MPRDPDRDDLADVLDMLAAARAVVKFVANKSLEDYVGDLLLRSAVERQVEIIGEAARRVSGEFQTSHPEIPWRPIIAQRHVLAHDYGEIVDERLWRVAVEYVPALIQQLEAISATPDVVTDPDSQPE